MSVKWAGTHLLTHTHWCLTPLGPVASRHLIWGRPLSIHPLSSILLALLKLIEGQRLVLLSKAAVWNQHRLLSDVPPVSSFVAGDLMILWIQTSLLSVKFLWQTSSEQAFHILIFSNVCWIYCDPSRIMIFFLPLTKSFFPCYSFTSCV